MLFVAPFLTIVIVVGIELFVYKKFQPKSLNSYYTCGVLQENTQHIGETICWKLTQSQETGSMLNISC